MTPLTAHILVLVLSLIPWQVEAMAWGVYYGVDPVTVLAVSQTESGNVPEPERFKVMSRGNVGIMQVNATVWHRTFNLSRPEFVRRLQTRTGNVLYGTIVLSLFQKRYRPRHGDGCRCGQKPPHHWTGHYNSGRKITPRGVRYGERVRWWVGRLTRP